MIKKLVSVYDAKAETFAPPVAAVALGEAVRSFEDAVNDPQCPFNKHPEDYTLFHLGEFDDSAAAFHLKEAPVSLGVALQFVKAKADA